MLSVGAYSFRQKARLAVCLSWVAGYTNAITFLMLGAVVVAHVTGHVTQVGLAAGNGLAGWFRSDWQHTGFARAGFFLYVVGAFYAGAVASGAMIEFARRHKSPSKFTIPMAVEAVLLCGLAIGIALHLAGHLDLDGEHRAHQFWMVGLGAASMGLQNATITRISGAVVRPTHLTGVVTDLGLETVQYVIWAWKRARGRTPGGPPRRVVDPGRPKPSLPVRVVARAARVWAVSGKHPSFQRLLLLGSVFSSFLFGTVIGTLMFIGFPSLAMVVPIAFLLWLCWSDRQRAVADVREVDAAADPDLAGHAPVPLPLRPDLGVYRLAHNRPKVRHVAPDFVAWVDGLPGHRRVLVLVIDPRIRFDANAALNLAAAVKRLRAARRDLVICGVGRHQQRVLDRGGLFDALHPENVAPDVGPAVARALALLADPDRDPADDSPTAANAPAPIA